MTVADLSKPNTASTQTKTSLLSNISSFNLAASIAILQFSFSTTFLALLFSWLVSIFDRQEWVVNRPQLHLIIASGVALFVVASICLFFSENWVDKRFMNWQKAVGKNILFAISFLILGLLLVAMFFGFAWYLVFIRNFFWI